MKKKEKLSLWVEIYFFLRYHPHLMKIIIVGAGITGSELAYRLIAKNHDVVLIERNEEISRHAANRLDCMVIHAEGNDTQILKDAAIAKADALIAVTDSDELNMIICGIAESLAPNVLKIARVRNENYVSSLNSTKDNMLGIHSLVYPDEEGALAIKKIIEHGAISDILSFNDSPFEITQFNVEESSNLDGVMVKDLRTLLDAEFIVVAMEKGNEYVVPSGETMLTVGMRLSILMRAEQIEKFYNLAGLTLQTFKKIAIAGMSRIGRLLLEFLLQRQQSSSWKHLFKRFMNSQSITVIESNEKIAKQVAKDFPDVKVYNADITDEAFAEEVGLSTFDLVISTTDNYELNMISSTYLKTVGVKKTIALVQSRIMKNIAYKIGIDVAIAFKDVVVDSIMSKLLGKNVLGYHSMCDGTLEIIELAVSQSSHVIGKALKDIAKHGIFLILLINKEGVYQIPKGETVIERDNKVIFIVDAKHSEEIVMMFSD